MKNIVLLLMLFSTYTLCALGGVDTRSRIALTSNSAVYTGASFNAIKSELTMAPSTQKNRSEEIRDNIAKKNLLVAALAAIPLVTSASSTKTISNKDRFYRESKDFRPSVDCRCLRCANYFDHRTTDKLIKHKQGQKSGRRRRLEQLGLDPLSAENTEHLERIEKAYASLPTTPKESKPTPSKKHDKSLLKKSDFKIASESFSPSNERMKEHLKQIKIKQRDDASSLQALDYLTDTDYDKLMESGQFDTYRNKVKNTHEGKIKDPFTSYEAARKNIHLGYELDKKGYDIGSKLEEKNVSNDSYYDELPPESNSYSSNSSSQLDDNYNNGINANNMTGEEISKYIDSL